jgi:hypothetical protein
MGKGRTIMAKNKWEKKFEEEMDKYVRHAGEWHDTLCHFVYDDQGVCNCDLSKNKRQVRKFIRHQIAQAKKEVLERIRKAEKIALAKGVKKYKKYNYDFNEGVFSMRYAIEDQLTKLKQNKEAE